jgi:hypothetical protein
MGKKPGEEDNFNKFIIVVGKTKIMLDNNV